jgi:alanyl-tRNA synthetase
MLFDGEKFFNLKDRHGLPLEMALDRIYDEEHKVDWSQFIRRGLMLNYKPSKLKKMVDEIVLESFINKTEKQLITNEVNLLLETIQ